MINKSLLYTRTGDGGTTALVSGNRIAKNHPRIEAYGTVDELNAHIGLLSADPGLPHDMLPVLRSISHRLFDLGAYLATAPEAMPENIPAPAPPSAEQVADIECQIDRIDSRLPPLRRFVLPGGTSAAAQANLARTVCRRAERRMLDLSDIAPLAPEALRYINRLSDLLFAMSRWCNISAGCDEIFWEKNC